MNYTKLLSRIAEQGLEKTWFHAVALFEGRLVQSVRSLLDLERSNQIKAFRWATIASVVAVMVCLTFGTVRLEAKSNIKESIRPQRENIFPGGSWPKGNCSISGKVISAKSGEPVGHAKVALNYSHDFLFVIEVASDGTFVFKDIPTGPFSLRTMSTAGFEDVYYNPEEKPGKYPKFSLGDKEERADVVLRVKPACSIAGKILDENGEPPRYGKLWVRAWVKLDEPGGNLNRYSIAGTSRIASDGSYSLDGLDGRPVYIMAIDVRSEEKDEFYPPCYYPGTVDRNKAKKVHFEDTKSVEEVNIRLQMKGEFILEGVVTDEKAGNPIPKALVTVHRRDMLFARVTAYTDEQGRYRIESIGAGEFLVHVDAEPWGFVRTRKPVEIKAATKTTSLGFTLRPGATISGKFVNENGNPIEIAPRAYGSSYRYDQKNAEIGSWSGVRNRYGVKGKAGYTSPTFKGGEGDYEEAHMVFPTPRTFIIKGIIPGKTILLFHPRTKGQTVKEILYKGKNIIETGIETKPGQETKDVTIVIGAS